MAGRIASPAGPPGDERYRISEIPNSFRWIAVVGLPRIAMKERDSGSPRPNPVGGGGVRLFQPTQGGTMDSQDMNRRAFGKLAAAALGGPVAGAGLVGAAGKDKPA